MKQGEIGHDQDGIGHDQDDITTIRMTLPILNLLKPLEDPLKAHLKESREAGFLQNDLLPTSINPLDAPIYCEAEPMKGSAENGDCIHEQVRLDDEYLASLRQRFQHVVTIADIRDKVFNADDFTDGKNGCADYNSVLVVKMNAEFGQAFDLVTSPLDPRAANTASMISDFIKGSDSELIEHLVQRDDPDEALRLLGHDLLDYFADHWAKRFRHDHFDDQFTIERAFYAALELLALGIQKSPKDQSQCGFAGWHIRVVRHALIDQAKNAGDVRDKLLMDRVRSIYQDHRAEFTSPTIDQEEDARLSPAQKSRVFMNALRERNDAGTLILEPVRDGNNHLKCVGFNFQALMKFRKADRENAQAFFERNRNVSVRSLLKILDACIRVHVEGITGMDHDKHEAFHANKGRIIPFLFKHLETITQELKTRHSFDSTKLLK